MKDLGRMLKQIQEAQGKMVKLQEELGTRTVEASAGGGMIKVVANGRHEIVSLHIDPQVIDPKDPEMLEDLILAAVNDARVRVETMVREEMTRLTGGLPLPGGFPG
jgi:nucleoid-associated protein EbfC